MTESLKLREEARRKAGVAIFGPIFGALVASLMCYRWGGLAKVRLCFGHLFIDVITVMPIRSEIRIRLTQECVRIYIELDTMLPEESEITQTIRASQALFGPTDYIVIGVTNETGLALDARG
eukprot:gene27557-34294_t